MSSRGRPRDSAGSVASLSVTVDQVSKRYRSTAALSGVSLELKPGVTAILGRNGAGKSTLMRLLVGVEEPTSGDVGVRGPGVSTRREQLRSTGWLPQAFGYPPRMRADDFVRYAAWLKEVDRRQVASSVDAAMELADVELARRRRLGELSGGTLRRVGLAAAMVASPVLVVLDEPTTGLDPEQRASMHERLRALAVERTIVMSTHLLEDVDALADRIYILDAGRVAWDGTVDELSQRSAPDPRSLGTLRASFLDIVGRAEE